MRTTPGKEDQELLWICSIRFTSLRNRLKAPQITAHTNVSQNSSSSHILTSTVKRRLHEYSVHGWIAANRPPLRETKKKKKRIVWAEKYKEWWNIQESSHPWDYYEASWTTADPSPYNLTGTFIIKHELIYINIHINTICITFLDRSSITKWIKEVHSSIAWTQVSLEVIRELRAWRKL